MKKMKRLAALFLAVVMVMAMGMTAMAAPNDEATGTITISNATKDETYKAYKIFDAVPSADGEHVAYTATTEMKEFFVNRSDNPFDFAENLNGSWNVTKNKNKSDSDVIDVLNSLYTKSGEDLVLNLEFASLVEDVIDGVAETASDGTSTTVTFSNVPYGYYLITSSLGAAVTVDSMTPNANVIDKNQSGPSWDDLGKSITAITDVNGKTTEMETELSETSANYGDTIKFKISIDTTNYEGAEAITEYNISDILGDGMSYVTPSDIKVSVVSTDTSYGTDGTKVLTKDTDYTVKTEKPANMKTDEDGFIINVPWADVTTNSEGEVTAVATKYPTPATLVVEYSAKVDADAVPAAEIKNTAGFTYKLAGEPDEKKPEEETKETTTSTYALAINKVTENATGLKDAKFMITKGNDTILVQATSEAGVYNYVGIATSEQVTAKNEATTESAGIIVKSPESGLIVVKGIDAGTYTITETEAPAGYNQLTNPAEVETVLNGTYTKTITFYYETDSDGNKIITDTVTDEKAGEVLTTYDVVATTVVNNAGALLPSTGGIGTTIFYVVGGILVVGAGVLLITKKRMSAREK